MKPFAISQTRLKKLHETCQNAPDCIDQPAKGSEPSLQPKRSRTDRAAAKSTLGAEKQPAPSACATGELEWQISGLAKIWDMQK